jgi:diguanylate cyclase (GGDEF)-like protein
MQITLAVVGLTYVGAAAIHVAVDYPVPPGAPISRLVVVVFVALVIVATICLSALRGAGTGGQRATPDSGGAPRALPLLEPETFRLVARDRLERASLVDAELSLVLAEVNDLAEINTAFGRESGDAVLAHFSRVVRSRVPVSAILGYLGGGRFGIMTTSDSRVTAATVVAAVRTGLSDSHVSPDMDLRIDASFGVSDTTTTPANIDLLLDAAVVDMARFARSALPNT